MHVIATAGHVDHGKSTLIRALTGMEPDRWAEEQRRGMTIDLGYAWTTLPSGETVAFVDVPGHQRFVTNMLAGVGPVPAVLFVVAADEGWSAQSAEHLDALDALQVRHGVLAITRADLGDAALAEEEARTYLAGTSLAGMEAVAVSPVAQTGLDRLGDALSRMVAGLPASSGGRTKLWVDRVFSIRGAGTVVTGTLTAGTISVGDQLRVHPSGGLVRVRGIESLKNTVDTVHGVARVALNLRGVKSGDLRRGDALAEPGQWLDADVLDVRVRPARKLPARLTLHMGSAAVPVRVRPLGADTARLTLDRPLPTSVGERGVLRDPGAHRVVAGAVVLDPLPPPLTRRGAARRRADELAEVTGTPDPAGEVRRRGFVRRQDLIMVAGPGEEPARSRLVGGWVISTAQWARWLEDLPVRVDDWARTHPLLPAMPRRSAATVLGVPADDVLGVLVTEHPDIVADDQGVHRVGQVSTLDPEAEHHLAELLSRLDADPFDAPEAPELAAAGLTVKVLGVAAKSGRLISVGAGIYLRPTALDDAVRLLSRLPQPFTLSDARQALGTTRRVAMPLLEHLDRMSRTERVDAQRRRVKAVR